MGSETNDAPLPLSQVLWEENDALSECSLQDGPSYQAYKKETLRSGAEDVEKELVNEVYRRIHKRAQPRTALCLSGGGIRSATFALGILHGLAVRGLLTQFDYISTVSGGGYVGSWLTAWMHRHKDGPKGVEDDLKAVVHPLNEKSKIEPRSVTHLREYSNYLTPRLGIFSGDSWSVAATYLRNLTLNWMVLFPLLASLFILPRIFNAGLALNLTPAGMKASPSLTVISCCMSWIALVTAVLFLPSVCHRKPVAPIPRTEEQISRTIKRGGHIAVNLFIVIPMLVGAVSSALKMWWNRNSPSVSFSDGLPGTALPVIFWLGVALSIWLGGILLKRPNRPRWLGLVFVFSLVGAIVFSSMQGLKHLIKGSEHAEAFAVLAVPALLGVFLLTITLYVGFTSWNPHPDGDDDREWWARLMGLLLIVIGAWLALSSIALFSPRMAEWLVRSRPAIAGVLASGVLGLAGGASAGSAATRGLLRQNWRHRLMHMVPTLAAPLFLLAFFACFAWAIEAGTKQFLKVWPDVAEYVQLPRGEFTGLVILSVLLLMIGLCLGRLINVNRFSLHAMYRNRLIRAYLGASSVERPPESREADPFTGFDPSDNIPMHRLRRPAMFSARDIADIKNPGVHDVLPALIEFIVDRKGRLSEYIRKEMDQVELRKLNSHRAAVHTEEQRRDALEIIVNALNRLLIDRNLIMHSRFRDEIHKDSDIEMAWESYRIEGSPEFLNRLILEKEILARMALPERATSCLSND